MVGDGWECQEKRAICEVWPADDILDAIEKNGAALETAPRLRSCRAGAARSSHPWG